MWLYYSWTSRAGSFNLSSQFNYGPFSSRDWGEEGFDFCVHRKTFHKPIWLTGKFYLLSPLSQTGSRKPPKPRRMDIVEQQNMAVFGAASPPHSWAVVPYQPPKPHSLPLDASPDLVEHMWNHARHLYLNHGYASERRNSTLEISFHVDSPSNRNFPSILKKTWV